MKPKLSPFPTLLAAAVLLAGCEQVEQVQDHIRDHTPHEAYLAALARAGLAQTALVKDWIEVGLRAVEQATVDFRVERFHAAVEELGCAGEFRNIDHGEARIA